MSAWEQDLLPPGTPRPLLSVSAGFCTTFPPTSSVLAVQSQELLRHGAGEAWPAAMPGDGE